MRQNAPTREQQARPIQDVSSWNNVIPNPSIFRRENAGCCVRGLSGKSEPRCTDIASDHHHGTVALPTRRLSWTAGRHTGVGAAVPGCRFCRWPLDRRNRYPGYRGEYSVPTFLDLNRRRRQEGRITAACLMAAAVEPLVSHAGYFHSRDERYAGQAEATTSPECLNPYNLNTGGTAPSMAVPPLHVLKF